MLYVSYSYLVVVNIKSRNIGQISGDVGQISGDISHDVCDISHDISYTLHISHFIAIYRKMPSDVDITKKCQLL